MARTAYTFLHLPMVGIIVVALGLKKILGYVGGHDGHTLADGLHGVPLVALYGGVATYLLALVAFKYRTIGQLSRARLVVSGVLLVAIPLVSHVPALVTLAALAVLLAGLIGYETQAYAAFREEVRHEERSEHAGPAVDPEVS
jgi:low temperature requirement protein LtrA